MFFSKSWKNASGQKMTKTLKCLISIKNGPNINNKIFLAIFKIFFKLEYLDEYLNHDCRI